MENDKQREEAVKASGTTHFADDATLLHIAAQQQEIDILESVVKTQQLQNQLATACIERAQEKLATANQTIDRLNAENERLNAKGAQLREALLAIRSKDMSIWTMYINAEELCVKALANTDTTWLDRKMAEAKREMLEEAAKWFEEDGCTLLPSSVECAVELRRMGADLKA